MTESKETTLSAADLFKREYASPSPTSAAGRRLRDDAAKAPRSYCIDAKTAIIGDGSTLSNARIVVEEGKIAQIGPAADVAIPKGCSQVISVPVALPGFIDCHVHPLIFTEDYQSTHLRRSSAYKTLVGLKAVQGLLHWGFTTLRVAGDADAMFGVIDLRRAIDEGVHQGPRIVGAAHYLSITGGGGDMNQLSPEVCCCPDGKIVDGADEMRKAVRLEKKYGADWIKLLVTGAYMSVGDSPDSVHFTPDEIAAAVNEATKLGMPVMAHAHAAEGIKIATRLGVRSIEHGSFVDAEGIQLMLDKGTWLVPTQLVGAYMNETYDKKGPLAKALDLQAKRDAESHECLRAAVKAGVRIAFGSDFIGWPPEITAREFELMVELGMTPMQAIVAGTGGAAELLRLEKETGTLRVGLSADIVGVSEDPLQSVRALLGVRFVMHKGRVVRNEYGADTSHALSAEALAAAAASAAPSRSVSRLSSAPSTAGAGAAAGGGGEISLSLSGSG